MDLSACSCVALSFSYFFLLTACPNQTSISGMDKTCLHKAVAFACPDDLRKRLDAHVRKSGRKKYSLLQEAVREYLDRVAPVAPQQKEGV